MPTINEMLAQYYNTPVGSTASSQGVSGQVELSVGQKTLLKQAEVDAVAQRKREILSGESVSEQEAYRLGISKATGYGTRSAAPLSKALLTNSVGSLVESNSPSTALRLLEQQMAGENSYGIDKNMPSTASDTIGDTALNITTGLVNTVGGIGAWAGSLINDRLGTYLSGGMDSFNNLIEPMTSSRSQSSRTLARITNELDTRDNEAQYQEDKTKGNVLAKLKREGRNALGAVSIAASDPTMLLEGTAKGIGSMAAFGYVNKAVQGIGGAGKVATMIRDASMPISGGLVGGGSIYQQTTSEIMAKSLEEMAKISPRFNEYVAQGMSPKDAQIRVAAEAGEYAASIAAPLGAATTMMAPGLEKLPVKVGSVKGAITSTLFEPKQEGVESFNEQLATNLGKQRVFDPKQDLAEGVGKAVGEGALYGLTSAGVTQAPGVAALGAKALKDGTSSFVGSMKEKIGALGEDNKNSSPVSDAALAATATTVATQVPAVAATMQAAVKDDPAMQEKVTNFTAIMQSVSTHDAADFDSASDSIKKALTGAVTKIDELTALKSVFNNKDSTDADRDFAGTKLVEELSAVNEFLNTQTDVIDAVQDEPTKKFVRDLKQLAANILGNKEFIATRNAVATRLAEKHKTSQPELAINADPTSQEGKQAIAETLAIASTLPTEVNEKAVEAILKHSERGSLKLTPTQKANLEISKAAIAALQDDLVEGSELMRVSTEAANAYEAGSKGKSAIQHATDIVRTMSEGNTSLAKTLLTSFQRFAQHYQNKAEAVNQATQEGNDQDYKAEYRQLAYGQWLKEKALYTFQKSGRGVELATQVHKEARAIGSMYNAIAAMYPDLQLDQVTLTEPDPIFLPNGKFDHKVTQHGIGGNGVAGITAYRNRLSIQQAATPKDDKPAREAAGIVTATLETNEDKLRFAAWADAHSGKSVQEVQLALVRSEFGPKLSNAEVKQVAEAISRAGGVVADQARINTQPAKQKSDSEKLASAIKIQKMRVKVVEKAAADARDVDQFGLPIENGPNRKFALELLKKAEDDLAALEAKAAPNGQGQKEKVLTTPPTEVGSGSTQQPTTVSPIGQEAVVTKGSKAPLTRLFGDVLSNAILNIIDSVNKEAVKNKTLDFDVFLVKFVKDISSIPSTGFDALNKVREQQSNVFESGEFEWTKKEQKFGDVYYYPKKQTKEGIEIEKYVYKTSTYEITRSGPTDTIIFNSPIKFGEFEVKTIYASPGSFKLVSEDYAQQYINNELYVYGKELDIKIGGTNKRNSMVTYRRKSGIRSNGLYATFYENYYKIDPKYRSKNSFPLVFDEKGNNSYSEIVTTNPQTPIVQSETTEPTIAEIQERLDAFTDDELRKEWNRIAAIAKPRPEIEEKTAKLIAATLRQRKADDEAAKAALPTQTLDEVFGNDRLEEAKKIAEEKAAYLAEMEKIGAFRSLYYALRDSVTKKGMFTVAEHKELFKDDNRFNFLRSKKPYVTLDALIPDGRFDAYGISRDYATGIQQIADKLKAGDFLTLADKIRLQEIEVKLAELENIPDEQLNELIALYEAKTKTKTEAEKTAKQRRDAKSKREARQAASKGGTSTTKINQGEQGTLESAEITPTGDTSINHSGSIIYNSSLGDKTTSTNVVILPWKGVLNRVKSAFIKEGIVSTRIQDTIEHFGNPYSASVTGLIKVDSDKDAVISYIDWVLSPTTDVNPEQHAWIREQLISGKLKGQPILYYKELNAPSHATALDYLINKHDWGNQATSVASATATPEPTNKINVWYGSGKVAGENAGLSNLAAREFTLEGRKYFSVEHAYQTYKSGLFDEVTYNKYKHAGVKISGKPAKKEKDYNIRLMRRIMLASFTQNKEAKDLLLSTGDAEITHTQDKGIWATKFPQLLMEIRSELRTASSNPVAPKAEAKKPGFILRLLAKIASGIDSTKPVEFVANPEQQEGIDKIKAFLKTPISKQNGNGIFVLEGKAGTGKTSLVQKAIEDHLKAGGKVHIAAVSHKAKGLLEHKLNQFITKNRYNSATVIAKSVAGLLGMVPLGRDGFGFKHGTMPGTAPLLSSDLVIIDEASMIDAKLKNLIESNRPPGTRIIYLGDVGQLAPVGSSNISPVFTQNLPENNKHTLSTRVRQGEDSSILPYADYYWDNSVNAAPVARPVPISERSNTQELQFINEKDIDTEVISVFDRAMKEGNNSLIKIIVYNNKAGEAQNADEINKLEARIREALFGKDNSDIAEYENGEFVIMNETFALSEQESVENSREFVVESAEKRTDTVVVNGREMSLDVFELSVVDKFSKENFVLPVIAKLGPISARKALAFSRALKAWGNEVYALPYGSTKDNRIAEYNAVKSMYADVGYSYALTSHKAQGSTYDISVVLEDNFNEGFRDNHADRSRAIYTALTRASKMAIVVSRINTEDIVNSVEPTKTNTEVPTSPPVPPSTPAPPSGPTKVVLKAVSPYHAKDQAKSDKATKFIGSGAPNSSTESYRASWGKLANSGVYTAEDVVFVSSNGNRPGRKLPYYTELSKAIAAGATILTDSKKDRDRTYNIGEREVAEYLLLNKYEELVDGTWTPKAVTTPAVNPISAEELNELNTFLAAKKRLTEIITNPSSYAPEVIVAAKKELTELTKERAKQVDYLFDGFPDELVELDFLSNVAPSLIANTAGKLERLWELRNKLGKLFADLGVSKLLSTAGNILIAGTKPVSKERVSQFIDRPFDTFVQIVNEKKDLKDNEKELRAALAEHITLRANLLKLGVERIVLDKVNSDNNLIKLLQLNHLDSLGNSNKHRVDLFPENRLFSLLAPIGKGDTPEVRLDPYLMETAALAFMQWMLSAADRKAVVDEKTVANILGIDENVVTEAQIAEYSERITNIEAIDAISAGIMRHWSLKPKDNIQLGYSEGVARVLAKEMLDVAVSKELVEAGFGLNHNQIRVDRTKTVDSYGVDKLPKNIKLANAIFPDLIDNTAFVENEQVMYIGDNVTVPVSKTILREPEQLLTSEQIRAQDNNQKTIHRIDESSYKLFMGIGVKGVFDILSLPEETDSLNVGHAKSIIGKKQGISAVFTKMEEVYQRVSNQAVDGDVHGVPIHYKFEYTSTNRLQMIGSHTPQASKWMRNVVLPTHGTIDASYGSMGYKLLMLSVAQNLGVSIQNYSIETNIDQITAKLDGEFANVIDLLKSRITSNEDKVSPALIEALKSAFGSKFTPSALYALHEYARYLATSDADKKNFNTGLYIEADGVNNGPAAALIMLGGAVELTREFFINAARVGYFIGSSDRTLNQQRQEDPTGLYEAGAQVLPAFLTDFRKRAAGFVIPADGVTPAIKLDDYFDHVNYIVSSLLPNFSMDENGNYTIGRSVIKNPLTKTVYGSGSRGMGNGLLKDMLEAFYEKLSIVKLYADSGKSLDQSFTAVFGEQYQTLFDSMDHLARYNVEIEGGQFVVKNGITSDDHLFQNENYLKFEVSGAAFTSMSNNINTFFSKQVKDAITDVMSPAVMDSAQLLARATSFRTEFMAYEFNKLYEAALAKRKNSDHLYRQADGLSNDELRAITNKLSKIFPYIKTTTQSFNPVGRSKVSNDNFIGVTSTQYKVTPSVFIPESAGVSGVPYMIIGLGDGRTIQIFSDGGPEDTLNIYDGIHMGLGKAEEYSKRANSAVWDAWQQGNPFGALFPSLSSFVSNYDWTSFVAAYKSEPEKIKPILAALRVKSIAGLPEHIANLLNNVSTSAKNIDATHQVLGEYKATIDQLASIGSPHVKPGKDIIIDDVSIAEINSKISSLSQANTDYAVSGIISSVAAKFSVPVPTKPVRYTLKSFIAKGGAANKTATIQSLMATGLLNNVSVEYGPLSAFSGKLTRDDYGGYDPKTNTIYIVSDKSGGGVETLTHEMIHAATFRAIANHYADPSNSAIANEVARLEALMESFLNRAALSKDEAVRDIFVKISGINNRSVKLNEFMAYGLSNPAMRADLASVNALKLSENIIDKYVGKIKQLIERILEIFGVKAQRTQYDQLVFNTVYVMAGGNNTAISNGQVLKMSISGLGTNDRLSKVTDFFVSSLSKHIKDQLDPAFANLPPNALNTKNPGEFTRANRLGLQVAGLISSKFNTTPQEQTALNTIIRTLATGAQMDGNIMSGIEELYTHFTKNLTVEDFLLVEPSAATQADTYEANEMYNLVMGNYTTAKDVYGRGQTLPIFFALGLVNDRFRAVLAKKGLPDALKIASTDTDTFLTSSANVLLSKMDRALTGTGKSTNTQQALDSIFSVLVQNGTDSLTLVGAGLNKTGSVVDGLNDRVVSAIEYVSAKLDGGADTVLASTSNVVLRSAARVVKSVAWSMDEKVAGPFGEVIVSLSNQTNLFKPLQSLIADFVGRTNSNKLLYDMIKFVRSSVQQDRQHYREELPSVLAAQFTRKLSDKEWTHLFTGLAKTDLAQLVDLIGIKDTVALLSEPTKISDRISTLEANLRNQVPTSWPKLQKKAKQLANYMMTGEYGPMLMRNADILQLNFGGNRDEIDSLVTLYALQKLEQPVKDTLLSLVQTQKTGIDTLVSYLSGQRKDDIHPNVAVRLNTYKGYIPSLQNESVSLKVMPDTEHAAMLEKGYIRTGKYEGSIIETKASSSYYFLNAPAKAAFSQGLIQNVHNTSGGVDTRTLFSTGLVAGRITDPRLVNKLAPYLNNDVSGNENLLPIFDGTGAIIALERGVRPDQLVQLKQSTHLAKMIGVWRGRQVEEYKSRAINVALVSRFKQMYSDDTGKNPATAREYINLFDSKDPIHKDALKLMPIYMRKALEAEFGKDTFMVRKDMIDSAIGYRTPSVGDAWTGISGWSPESLEMAKRVTMTVFGNKAYEYLVNAEQMLKNAIQDVKLIIVVKSVIVPVGNMLSNVIQLMARGVPIKDIVRNIPKKISEVTFYTKQRLRKIELEVALRAAEGNNDIIGIRKAKNELETIEDSFRRLSIWPLINAGEFSAISDVGIARDDIVLSEGRLHTYMENLVDKLPEGVRTAAKYGLVAKDTALFQGLQKAVEYGDFLAKAIEYDYLIGSKKLSKEDSLARISEEFVNYDLLMGRFREYAENIGLVWFTAFKVRSTKIAASIIRNNPFHALMSALPHSFMPAGTGSPITDNGVAKVLSGDIWYSLGFGQALRAPALNPWVNLAH